MKDVRKTYYFLMIFLLIWFVVPTKQLFAQPNNSELQQVIEQQILDNLPAGNAYGLNGINIELPGYLDESDDLENRRRNLLDGKDGNYVSLYMKGNHNNVTARQEEGKGNVMGILIDGDKNNLNYHQSGSNNYLLDAVVGNNHQYEISQSGNALGLHLQGPQTIPNMIINQKGHGMKLKITGRPLK